MMRSCVRLFIALVVVMTGAQAVSAQNYYVDGQDIVGNGFVYKCKGDSYVSIYSRSLPYPEMRQMYKNGNYIPPDKAAWSYTDGEEAMLQTWNIIASSLTPAEKSLAKQNDDVLVFTVYIDSDSGEAEGVEFEFRRDGGVYVNIPPERYFQMERTIIQQVRVTLTAEGRARNYNLIFLPMAVKFL